ncbi:uncharacterized protein K444DRAFT_579548 [Hyaloscypha bicolor E]|uniref:Alpha/beta-hydrolase n=1 Tax=Hyaloscypha bicolor E TaxID=1095630 RepID=A0A2J6TTN2_9HELO|nr:uncharacterized protein K444DRAFT_579548 [Hyaloscypha bicolor E]PMD66384.1 hypothetical protein K444DRAFT_579548 [Hyaloscypha bicolor E]
MVDITSDRAVGTRSIDQSRVDFASVQVPGSLPANLQELSDDMDDMEPITISNITNEDAHSLIEPSLSLVASRLKSPQTPALEKAAVMEELEGGGLFDSELESPPVEAESHSEGDLGLELPVDLPAPARATNEAHASNQSGGLSLEELPSPKLESPGMPTPWHAGAKTMVLQRGDVLQQSPLHGVFDTSRTRSLSGGAEALKKLLPKGLPSMAQVGNLFGSSSGSQKSRHRGSSSFSKDFSGPSSAPRSPNPTTSRFPNTGSLPNARAFESIITTHPQVLARQGTSGGPPRPKAIRRSTSDNSLLYHSLSRASSLGDDTRFEKHTEQVNSRVKAIRDSLQDRSSFRMPTMPSMPSMPRVPSFSFSMSFLTTANVPWRTDTDVTSEILPTAIHKRTPDTVTKPAIDLGMIGAAISKPEAAIGSALPMMEGSASTAFDRALESLTGDVVIMGGYRGSILRSTKTNRQVWVPVKVGLNIRKVDLEVGLNPEDEERMPETIYPSGMLQNIGPVDISRRLFKRLSECENARSGKLRVYDYGYDWRLSPHLLSRQLTEFLDKLPSNSTKGGFGSGALVIAHSLGGLITRHVVNKRPELFSGVVYAGVPKSCVNILGPLRNGDAVLLSSRVLTAQVNFTLRTSFVLLPEDGGCFFDINTRQKYPVDFFSIDDWIKYRWSPCTDPPLPPRNPQSGGLGGLLNKSSSLLNLPLAGKKSISGTSPPQASANTYDDENKNHSQSPLTMTTRAADIVRGSDGGTDRTLAPQMGSNTNPVGKGHSTNQSVSTAVTLPREKAIAYLRRTLAEAKKFKQELHFKPELSESNQYPPVAVIYGKSIPTVYGAKVDGREGIPCSDVYDNLAFASGDGVCLAREAMLPDGYKAVNGGRISSDRGHVTLLGDLNAVGRALEAVIKGRVKGIGKGVLHASDV